MDILNAIQLSAKKLRVNIQFLIQQMKIKKYQKKLSKKSIKKKYQKKVSKKYRELRSGIKNVIETINDGKLIEYCKDFIKIKFNADDNMPLKKPLNNNC